MHKTTVYVSTKMSPFYSIWMATSSSINVYMKGNGSSDSVKDTAEVDKENKDTFIMTYSSSMKLTLRE